jgi:hypothetical protein
MARIYRAKTNPHKQYATSGERAMQLCFALLCALQLCSALFCMPESAPRAEPPLRFDPTLLGLVWLRP